MIFSFIGFIILLIGIIFSAYYIPTRFDRRKLGIWLSTIITLTIFSPVAFYILEDYLFFKSDVKEYFEDNGYILKDDFKIKSNDIIGLTDYYQKFEIEISSKDKQLLTDQLNKADYFNDSIGDIRFDIKAEKARHSDVNKKFYVTFENHNNYEFQSYLIQAGHTPRWDKFTISKKENTIYCQRIED